MLRILKITYKLNLQKCLSLRPKKKEEKMPRNSNLIERFSLLETRKLGGFKKKNSWIESLVNLNLKKLIKGKYLSQVIVRPPHFLKVGFAGITLQLSTTWIVSRPLDQTFWVKTSKIFKKVWRIKGKKINPDILYLKIRIQI